MSYEILSQKDTQAPTAEDSENEQFHSSQRRISVSILTLLVLSSTTLISVLLLLLLFATSRASRQCPVQNNGWSVSRTYPGENTSHMSLDHEYDYMWSDFEPITGFGLIYKENPDTAGMISMFHQAQCLAVFRQALQVQQDGLDIGHGEKEIPHARHCLDYMYQVLGLSCEFEATVREANEVLIS
ncbi:hypothetical protein BP5796_02725 [Coleophoma crateriformis]|uniref:Uncharacterized protein n=1 Tax=Coleophoma crateriformis TaxID=565419 RepID=A0A3D8SZ49_9HELO|nr:hypothetical protein BP5796_02725 [Coleophoma crateriformis]